MRPNWDSWLTRGSLILMGYGGVLTVWLALAAIGRIGPTLGPLLLVAGGILAALTACYTGWLFGQAKGRVLWMRRGLWLHLIVQAVACGAAGALVLLALTGSAEPAPLLRSLLAGALLLHAAFVFTAGSMAPSRRETEYASALELVHRGPFARRHLTALLLGVVVPVILLLPGVPAAWVVAAVSALVGLFIEEDLLVKAGQALPIS